MDATIKLKVGFVVMKHGDPVRTGRSGTGWCNQPGTVKLYQTAGAARRVARGVSGIVVEAFIEVPA